MSKAPKAPKAPKKPTGRAAMPSTAPTLKTTASGQKYIERRLVK